MRSLSALIRLVILSTLLAAPFGGVGWWIAGRSGCFWSIALVFALLFLLGISLEKIVASFFRSRQAGAPGLDYTLARACRESSAKVLLIRDPRPNLWVVRGIFGSGTLLIAQALSHLLNEEEMRAFLAASEKRLLSPELPLQTACALLAELLLSFCPSEWTGALLGGADTYSGGRSMKYVRLIGWVMLYPWIRLVLKLAGERRSLDQEIASIARSNANFDSAMRKIRQVQAFQGREYIVDQHFGLQTLGLAPLNGSRAILPIVSQGGER